MLPSLWGQFRDLDNFMNAQIPSVFNQRGLSNSFIPAVDIYEKDNNVMVEMLLGNVDPDQVNVEIKNGMIMIQGEEKNEREVEEKNYYRREVRTGSFYRQVPLPVAINEDAVSAVFEEGMLKITCPKVEDNKGKTVSVKVKKD